MLKRGPYLSARNWSASASLTYQQTLGTASTVTWSTEKSSPSVIGRLESHPLASSTEQNTTFSSPQAAVHAALPTWFQGSLEVIRSSLTLCWPTARPTPKP